MGTRALVLMAIAGCDSYDGLLKPPIPDGLQLTMQVTVQPGEERTICKNFRCRRGAFDVGRSSTR
jgi:hypothetical protein